VTEVKKTNDKGIIRWNGKKLRVQNRVHDAKVKTSNTGYGVMKHG
jgi:hypothetical protein